MEVDSQPPPPSTAAAPLPYDGDRDLEAAIAAARRSHDTKALVQLMRSRPAAASGSAQAPAGPSPAAEKAQAVKEALEAVGLSLAEVEAGTVEMKTGEDEPNVGAGGDEDVAAARLLERAKSALQGGDEPALLEALARREVLLDQAPVPPSLLRTLSADSLFFLTESTARHRDLPRRRVFDALREMASLHRDRTLSGPARRLLKLSLLDGKLTHVTALLGLFRRRPSVTAPSGPVDGPIEPPSPGDVSHCDSLMADLMVSLTYSVLLAKLAHVQ